MKNINYPKSFDKYTDMITENNSFFAFIDLMSAGNRILVTHPGCTEFNFIEEGIVNYRTHDNFRLFTIDIDKFPYRINYLNNFKLLINSIFRILRGRSLRLLSLPIAPSAYANFKDVKYHCFSEKAFLNVSKDKKVIIPFDIIKDDLKVLPNNVDLSGKILWIGDSLVKFYGITLNDYQAALIGFLENINHKFNKELKNKVVYFKFKNGQTKEEIDLTLNIFGNFGYKTEILDNNLIMESILFCSKNITVLGNASSLLIYASLLGHDAYTLFTRISQNYAIPMLTEYPDFFNIAKPI